jgi:hypothetical protein
MQKHGFTGFVGVIEWDPERDLTVIIGASAHQVRRAALGFLVRINPITGEHELNIDASENVNDFLTVVPVPDLDDAQALQEWFEVMREATMRPLLTIFGPQEDPGNAVGSWYAAPEVSLQAAVEPLSSPAMTQVINRGKPFTATGASLPVRVHLRRLVRRMRSRWMRRPPMMPFTLIRERCPIRSKQARWST